MLIYLTKYLLVTIYQFVISNDIDTNRKDVLHYFIMIVPYNTVILKIITKLTSLILKPSVHIVLILKASTVGTVVC